MAQVPLKAAAARNFWLNHGGADVSPNRAFGPVDQKLVPLIFDERSLDGGAAIFWSTEDKELEIE